MEEKSKVYVLLDERNRIMRCEGGYTIGNIRDIEKWTLIDEGKGERYDLCQTHYFPKPVLEEHGIPVYKVDKDGWVERTMEEIQADIEALPPAPPTYFEKLNAQTFYTAAKTGTVIGKTHEEIFAEIRKSYDVGIYTREQVQEFVQMGIITQEEANEITGDVPPQPHDYDEIKRGYADGKYSKEDVWKFVFQGFITEEEAKGIIWDDPTYPTFTDIKTGYDKQLYSYDDVWQFEKRGYITEGQAWEIVGKN